MREVRCYLSLLILCLTLVSGCGSSVNNKKNDNLMLKVMSYNILGNGRARKSCTHLNGVKTSTENRIPLISKIIASENPDVVFIQECNSQSLETLGRMLGMQAILATNHGPCKVGILTKLEVLNYEFLADDNPFAWNILYVDVRLDNASVLRCASVHFGWWGSPEWSRTNQKTALFQQQADILVDQLQKQKNRHFVIGGDFNMPSYLARQTLGEEYCYGGIPLSKLGHLDNKIEELGYVDTCYSSNDHAGLNSCTTPVGRIDRIFVNSNLVDKVKNSYFLTSEEAYRCSDHLPLVTILDISELNTGIK